MVCLMGFVTKNPPMLAKLNRKRALFVLTKIDEILAWEQRKEAEQIADNVPNVEQVVNEIQVRR